MKQTHCDDTSQAVCMTARHHPTFTRQGFVKYWVPLSLCLAFSSTLALADERYDSIEALTAEASFLETIPQARGVLKAGDERYQNQDQLFKAGAAGQLDVSVARSEMQQAAAERDALNARLKKCSVYAPYAGIIAEKHIAAYETPALNAPLYTIHRAGTPDISIIIPSKWLRHIDKGTDFKFTVDETGNVLNGKITRIGAAVDPVSQTIEVTGKITSPAKRALSGMSGLAVFDMDNPS